MRQILHIDMNSYFATVEQQANPRLRGKPIAVLGSTTKRSIIVAASIEAKKLGIKTAMPIEEAKTLCPELILINGEPRKYSWVTKQFVDIFERYTDKVEIFSIDECFLDVTETAHLYSSKKRSEERSLKYSSSRILSNNNTFAEAINIAKNIKNDIRTEIGSWISCSVGVSYNKFLAKTGSDLKKPDGLVVITPSFCHSERSEESAGSFVITQDDAGANFLTVDQVLLSLPLSEYCGIGRRVLKRLNLLDIYTTKDLREAPNTIINKEFGIATGEKLKRMSYGLDNSKVTSWRDNPPAKSVSCSRTVNRDIVKQAEIEKQILFLFEKVAKIMRDHGYYAREVGIWLRFKDFSGKGKTARLSGWTNDGLVLNKAGKKILREFKIFSPVRAIGVYAGQIQISKNVPQSLLKEDALNEKILTTMDAVNNRFGTDVITRASLTGTKLKEVVSGMGRDKF